MATAGVNYEDMQKELQKMPIVAGASTPTTSTRVSASTGGMDLAAADRITGSMNAAIKAQIIGQDAAAKVQQELAVGQSKILTEAAAGMQKTGEAAGRLTEATVEGQRKAQQENIATRDILRLDPNDASSVLKGSVDTFIAAADAATLSTQRAGIAASTTLGSVIRGEHSFGDWIDATFVKDPEDYMRDAAVYKEIAATQADKITKLQAIYTAQAPINNTAQDTLKVSSAADAATIAAQQYVSQATELQKQSISTLSSHVKELFTNSQYRTGLAVSTANTQVAVENAKRSWMAYADSTADKDLASYTEMVNVARDLVKLPRFTEDQIKVFRSNPANKKLLDAMGFQGMQLIMTAKDPAAGIPNIMGDPGEAAITLQANRGTLPQGMERIQEKLQSYIDTIPARADGKPHKPDEVADYVNRQWKMDVANITDVDSHPIFGQPNIADVVKIPALHTPEAAPFVTKVLAPLAASGSEYVPMKMIEDLAVKSDLSNHEIQAGMLAYAKAAQNYVAVTRKHELLGADAPKGYKAVVKSPTQFGFGSRTVDWADPKAVGDHIFQRRFKTKDVLPINQPLVTTPLK